MDRRPRRRRRPPPDQPASAWRRYPVFSPDGTQIAFTGEYDGNLDVYVIPAAGGEPRRLTYHPDPDVPVGWTPDGKTILFRSPRASYSPLPPAVHRPGRAAGCRPSCRCRWPRRARFSPDGKRIAYVPFSNKPQFPGAYRSPGNYRGGTASPLWIADLADSSIDEGAAQGLQRLQPDVGRRHGLLPLRPRRRRRRCSPTTRDTQAGHAGCSTRTTARTSSRPRPAPDAIVYEQFGALHLFDLKTEQGAASSPSASRPTCPASGRSFEKVGQARSSNAGLSPTGARAVFEARGEILTVPAEKGDIRNLTNTPGVAERDPAWSPDGKSIAYFSDESGEYELHVRAAERPRRGRRSSSSATRRRSTTTRVWSPDSKKIAYTDKRLNLWYHRPRHAANRPRWTPTPTTTARRRRRLVAGRQLAGLHPAAEDRTCAPSSSTRWRPARRSQVTDGMSDARYAGVRQGRQVPLLHRQHRRRPGGRLGHVDLQPAR